MQLNPDYSPTRRDFAKPSRDPACLIGETESHLRTREITRWVNELDRYLSRISIDLSR